MYKYELVITDGNGIVTNHYGQELSCPANKGDSVVHPLSPSTLCEVEKIVHTPNSIQHPIIFATVTP